MSKQKLTEKQALVVNLTKRIVRKGRLLVAMKAEHRTKEKALAQKIHIEKIQLTALKK